MLVFRAEDRAPQIFGHGAHSLLFFWVFRHHDGVDDAGLLGEIDFAPVALRDLRELFVGRRAFCGGVAREAIGDDAREDGAFGDVDVRAAIELLFEGALRQDGVVDEVVDCGARGFAVFSCDGFNERRVDCDGARDRHGGSAELGGFDGLHRIAAACERHREHERARSHAVTASVIFVCARRATIATARK